MMPLLRGVRWPVGVALALTLVAFSGCLGSSAPVASAPVGTLGHWSASEAERPRHVRTLGDPGVSGLDAWTRQFDNPPTVYDIDGDGVDEVIAHGADANVYVFSSAGAVLATLATTYPPAWHIERILNSIQVGVLRPGEPASIVVANHAAYVSAWTYDPAGSRADALAFHKAWEHRMNACHRSPSMDAGPALGDLDGDGALEIVVQTEEMGFFALNPDGSTRWHQCWSGGNSAPIIDDLDGDGRPEVIIASDAGFLSVLDGSQGNAVWTFDAGDPAYGIRPASIAVSPTVADLDGRAPKEILFTARHAPSDDADDFASFHMAIFAVRQSAETWEGELVWMRQPSWANPMSYTRLVVHDVDGDGAADIFGMDWNTIGHRPGAWERLGPANVFRLDEHGEDVWVRELDAWWSNQDIVVADSDGDGSADVLVNGPGEGGDGIWRLSAATGMAEGFLGLAPWKMLRGPVLADLRHDGTTHMLLTVAPMDGSDARGAILLFELGNGARILEP